MFVEQKSIIITEDHLTYSIKADVNNNMVINLLPHCETVSQSHMNSSLAFPNRIQNISYRYNKSCIENSMKI